MIALLQIVGAAAALGIIALVFSLPLTLPLCLLLLVGAPGWLVALGVMLVWLLVIRLIIMSSKMRCKTLEMRRSTEHFRGLKQSDMKLVLAVLLALLPVSASAQFSGGDEPAVGSVQTALDEFDAVLRAPVIEPIEPIEPVFQPFVNPVLDADPLAEDCDLEPQVAQVYRAAVIAEADCPTYLGRLSANPYAADSTANPYSPAGSPYSAKSVNNPYGAYGSPFSPTSARNPYATDAPKIVAQDGTYLGELSDNPYDTDSVANPYGRYGSPYSSTSIKNPYSTYGSPFSSQSPNNPYATQAPLLFGD